MFLAIQRSALGSNSPQPDTPAICIVAGLADGRVSDPGPCIYGHRFVGLLPSKVNSLLSWPSCLEFLHRISPNCYTSSAERSQTDSGAKMIRPGLEPETLSVLDSRDNQLHHRTG
jgi:hypothetical protein